MPELILILIDLYTFIAYTVEKQPLFLFRLLEGNKDGGTAVKSQTNVLFPFHSKASHSKIEEGQESPANLENSNKDELTSVQASREFTTPNGCHVKVFFSKKHDPGIRKEIARLLLTAFEQERIVDDETSHVSVQSINQRTG